MAYDRTFSLMVSGGSGGTIDFSEFDVRFDIKQNTTQAPNLATIRIFNVSRTTALMVPETGGKVTVSAGYKDESTGVIFTGSIFQRRIGKESPVVRYLDIEAKGGDDAYNHGTVSKTLAKGSTPMDHVKEAVKGMAGLGDGGGNVKLGYVSQGLFEKPQASRATSLWGMSRDILRRVCRDAGAQWSIQGDEVQIVKDDDMRGASGSGVIEVNSKTGMIGIPTETPNGIIVRTLLDARLTVNNILKINEADITRASFSGAYGADAQNALIAGQGVADGTYRILAIDRIGHKRGQEWYNDCVCLGAKSGNPTPGTAGTYTTADGTTHVGAQPSTVPADAAIPPTSGNTPSIAAQDTAAGTGIVRAPTGG